jgi:predicted nucleotide-binding protein (sugar kinase/HSP70/actin superfamily)
MAQRDIYNVRPHAKFFNGTDSLVYVFDWVWPMTIEKTSEPYVCYAGGVNCRQQIRVELDCFAGKADVMMAAVLSWRGEFYVVLEPFSNFDIESELGKLGVEVRRTTFISEWLKFSLFLNPLGMNEKGRIHRAALPYLKRDIGGDGWESVGEMVLHAKEYDGLVHLAPFTCMPEIVAQNIMPKTKENIPVLTILCDEQMGKPGMLTRLEAFVDLLEHRRRAKKV